MSKLHFYVQGANGLVKNADGDGVISNANNFDVSITMGAVREGVAYRIAQGAGVPSDQWYNCTASSGGTASFRLAALLEQEGGVPVGQTAGFHVALAAVQKAVTIQIAREDLMMLKQGAYKLCFAKKVAEGDYNVVWQSINNYLTNNQFSWTPQYQLFGSNVYQDGVVVQVATNVVNIGPGETSVLDEDGVLGEPKTGGKPTSITLQNNYGSIHVGLNQLSTGIDGRQISTPIFLTPRTMVSGDVQLTPIDRVLVWFEQDIRTSTIFSTARSRALEIDLTFTNSATRLYAGQQWKTP